MRQPISFWSRPTCRSTTNATADRQPRRKIFIARDRVWDGWGKVFCLETQRALSNDWVVRYGGRLLQVERHSYYHAPARSKVIVQEWESGKLEIRYLGRRSPGKRSWLCQSDHERRKCGSGCARYHRPQPILGGEIIGICVASGMLRNGEECGALKAVEKMQNGVVKQRLSHLAWKSRARDSHFSHSFDCSVYMTNTYRTKGDISIVVK